MTKILIYILTLLTILLTSCGKYKYWDISKFNMDTTALEDNEEIKIFYANHGPGNNHDLEYYNHLIVISQKTGDTVNVLTTANNGLTDEYKDTIFNFFNQDNVASKIAQMDPDDLGDIKNIDDINKIEMKQIDKVVRDSEYDAMADNNYPTIIGSIGKFKPNNE